MPQTNSDAPLLTSKAVIAMARGATRLAKAINAATPDRPITPSAITQWKYKPHGMVPVERAKIVAKLLNVPFTLLRPDFADALDKKARR